MASRALARVASSPDDYVSVYSTLLDEVDEPVVLHWLGTMFDPALEGYWGSAGVDDATATFRGLIDAHAAKVDGVKVSLLDAQHEIALRAALPDGVRLYTGDDFNYPELIMGDGDHHSDALLGIFAWLYLLVSIVQQTVQGVILPHFKRSIGHGFHLPTGFSKAVAHRVNRCAQWKAAC
jgi:hypothetical protein